MSEITYHLTREDLRKVESKESHKHGGNVPADSDASVLKSMIDEKSVESKQEKIDRVQGNLSLPDQPPTASDWNSASADAVNVGSGGQASDISKGDAASTGLREPQSAADPDLSNVGRQGVEKTGIPPPGTT